MSSRKVFCGTPDALCSGSIVTANAAWDWRRRSGGKDVSPKSAKLHHSHQEAFKCHCRYLIGQGYKRVGSREFESPSGPVLVLDKQSHFGMEWRKGKEGDKSGSRFVPMRVRGGIAEATFPQS
jgi:hypothetical protein